MRHLRYLPLLIVPLCWGVAFAQEAGSVAILAPQQTPPTDLSNYLLGLGPVGALLYGAFLVGKVSKEGIKVTVRVELTEEDRKLAERAVDAMEDGATPHLVRSRGGKP